MAKEVLLVRPRGFCAGVVRAVDIVELCLKQYGAPVYMSHEIVHNQAVVADLEAKGAIFVSTVDEVPEGSTVIFSAHGSPPEQYRAAEARKLNVVDATCPLVYKVHNEARKYGREGRQIIVIGHRDHVEVVGSMGQAREATPDVYLMDPDDEPPELPGNVAVLTQTTLSQDDVAPAVERIRELYPQAIVRSDICFATTNRQTAVKKLAEEVDIIIVVGSHESSNSNRLAETARRAGCQAVLVPSGENIPWFLLLNARRVGVSSGASTPEWLVEEVVKTLEKGDFVRREIEVVTEDVSFRMPKELVEV